MVRMDPMTPWGSVSQAQFLTASGKTRQILADISGRNGDHSDCNCST